MTETPRTPESHPVFTDDTPTPPTGFQNPLFVPPQPQPQPRKARKGTAVLVGAAVLAAVVGGGTGAWITSSTASPSTVSSTVGNSTFGQISGAGTMRQLQLGLRFRF